MLTSWVSFSYALHPKSLQHFLTKSSQTLVSFPGTITGLYKTAQTVIASILFTALWCRDEFVKHGTEDEHIWPLVNAVFGPFCLTALIILWKIKGLKELCWILWQLCESHVNEPSPCTKTASNTVVIITLTANLEDGHYKIYIREIVNITEITGIHFQSRGQLGLFNSIDRRCCFPMFGDPKTCENWKRLLKSF